MERRRDSLNGMEGAENKQGQLKVAKPAAGDVLLRLLALILTLTAAIVVGTDNQTKTISFPPDNITLKAKWHYLSAYVFYFVANVIACAYAAVSLAVGVAMASKSKYLGMVIVVLDGLMVALLYAGIGAGFAVGVIGSHGNAHAGWNKVCNIFGRFCHQILASIALSFAGSIAFLLLLLLPFLRLLHFTTS